MPLPTADRKASAWLRYAPRAKRFYISYRGDQSDPKTERLYGPFDGDPLERLGVQAMMRKSLQAQYNPDYLYRIRLMLRTRDRQLAERAAELLRAVLLRPGDASELSAYMGSVKSIIEEHSATWKEAGLEAKGAELTGLLQSTLERLESLVVELPDDDYMAAGDVKPQPPKKIDKGAWGQPVNGLRLAIEIDPDSAPVGAKMQVNLVVQNVSHREIRLGEYDLRQSAEADVRSTSQNQLKTRRSFFTGRSRIRRFRLKPQEMAVISQVSVQVVENLEDAQRAPGCTLIHSPNEKRLRNQVFLVRYRIRFGQVISWGRNDEGVMVRVLPAKGEWTGELSSGQVGIAVHRRQ